MSDGFRILSTYILMSPNIAKCVPCLTVALPWTHSVDSEMVHGGVHVTSEVTCNIFPKHFRSSDYCAISHQTVTGGHNPLSSMPSFLIFDTSPCRTDEMKEQLCQCRLETTSALRAPVAGVSTPYSSWKSRTNRTRRARRTITFL